MKSEELRYCTIWFWAAIADFWARWFGVINQNWWLLQCEGAYLPDSSSTFLAQLAPVSFFRCPACRTCAGISAMCVLLISWCCASTTELVWDCVLLIRSIEEDLMDNDRLVIVWDWPVPWSKQRPWFSGIVIRCWCKLTPYSRMLQLHQWKPKEEKVLILSSTRMMKWWVIMGNFP